MPRTLTTDVFVAEVLLAGGGRLVVPFGHPEHVCIGEADAELAQRLARAWQRSWIDEGRYLDVVRSLSPAMVSMAAVTIAIDAPREAWRYPAHVRRFDMIVAELAPGLSIGMVPALGIEASGEDLDSLTESMAQNLRLELVRNRRLEDARRLAALSWCLETRTTPHRVTLELHTPAELEAMAEGQEREVLPRAASPMTPPLDEPIGLETELEALSQCLAGTPRRSVLIVGPTGSGKTALLGKHLRARRRARAKPPWETSAARLVQALTTEGAWQGELAMLCRELAERDEVLYVNHLHELFEVGQYEGNAVSIGDALREPLERGEIVLVAEATEESIARLEARSGGVTALFEHVTIEPGEPDARRSLLRAAVGAAARRARLEVDDEAIDTALALHQRFFPYSGFPGKPIRFLESLLIAERERPAHEARRALDRERVIEAFCRQSGIPPAMLDDRVTFDIEATRADFRARLIGQEHAIDQVVGVLASVKTELMRAGRPLANLLFVGPTGVGKTELARSIAGYLFGDPERVLRLDMSEYSDPDAVLRLTGDRHGAGTSLASRIRQRPFSVVLFDELEKAHPSFFDLLLQILGDGRLTDGRGEVSSFCSALIVMTSNVGAEGYMRHRIGFSGAREASDASSHFSQAVEDYFRPELFNRLDQVVAFDALGPTTRPELARREIDRVIARAMTGEHAPSIEVDDAVGEWLGTAGYDARFGAREMKRTVHRTLTVPLAEALNAHPDGRPLRVRVASAGGRLTVDDAGPAASTAEQAAAEGDRRAEGRRHIQAVRSGALCIALLNERDRLLEVRRRAGRRFWDDEEAVRRLRLLDDLAGRLERHLGHAIELECQSLLALEGAPGDDGFDEWEGDYRDLRRTVYHAAVPESARAAVGVFGPAGQVAALVEVYADLCARRGYDVGAHAVQLVDDGYVIEPLPLSPEARAARRRQVGHVLTASGACAALYFGGEAGVHRHTTAEGGRSECYVDVQPSPEDVFDVPEDVHRRSFYEDRPVRRHTTPWEVSDRDYGLKLRTLDTARLEQHLAERFERVLDEALVGRREAPAGEDGA